MSKIESLMPEQGKIMAQYIFDDSKVLKLKTFTQLKLNNETFAYGLLLPKEVDLFDKKGNIIGQEQMWRPVLITSNSEIIEATKETELKHKIKFETIPTNLPLRWSLESIKVYLEGDEKFPKITPKELFEKIENQYQKFCFFKEKTWYKINVLWDSATYLFMLFDNFPIKEEKGLQNTGKSKCMNVSRNLSFNSSKIMINPSESTLFRETHDKRITKYLDEAEKLFSFKNGKAEFDQRVELINGSYSQGSTIPRVEKVDNKFVCVYYNCYSPSRIGSINGLYGATESRTITQIHTRSLDNDPRGETEPDENDYEWQILRDYLYLFGLKYWKKVEESYRNNSMFENIKLKKRDLQIWKPLLTLAKVVDESWFNEVLEFAEKISMQRKEDFILEDSWDYQILSIIKEMLENNQKIIRPKLIKERYNIKFLNEGERPLHEKKITSRLDNLGFKTLRQLKDREGISYLINKDDFQIIVSPICPDLTNYSSNLSHSSQISISKENNVTNGDKSIKNVTNNNIRCDENDENDENDECSEMKVEQEKIK